MHDKHRKKVIRKWLFRTVAVLIFISLLVFATDFVRGVFYSKHQSSADIAYYYNVVGTDKIVALTFDDGPDPIKTQQVMEILDKHEVPATFFLLGSKVLQYPEIVEDIASAGYEIGNHSFTHSSQVHHSQRRIQLELEVTNKLISNITGVVPVLYRPPYLLDIGSDPIPDPSTPVQAIQWISQLGFISVGADIDSLDWQATSPSDLIANVHAGLNHGHIILLHDGGLGLHTVEALDELITSLKSQGYQFTTVSEIIGLHAAEKMTVTQDLTLGMTDAETNGNVSALQTFLLMKGFYLEKTDGVFGISTQTALQDWQLTQDLTSELGFVGASTREKIVNALEHPLSSQSEPSLINQSELQRKLQHFYTVASSHTGKNIPVTMLIILGLVVARILGILVLFWLSLLKRRQKSRKPTRGVSVIIPVFNEAENIAATIISIILNRYPKYEIIAVNDGSIDNSSNIIRTLQQKFPGIITLISTSNQGKAAALNVGIGKAQYNTIITMDGDTVFHSRAMFNLIRNFADKNVTAVAGKVCVASPKDALAAFQHLEYVISQNIEKKAFTAIDAIGVIPGPIGAWRKSALIAAGGFSNETLVEDQDLTLALLSQGKRIVYEPEAIAYTESPHTLADFIKQRLRWVYGTIQCAWKYLKYLGSVKRPRLGWVLLPNIFVYSILLALFYPLMDILLLVAIFASDWHNILLVTLLFIVFDLIYSLFASLQERQHKQLLALLPFQRIFYRFVIWYVVLKSVIRAIEGTDTFWNRVAKHGDAAAHHFLLFEQQHAVRGLTANQRL